ncbi:MAG TPA: SPFH domain-containing protein [Candidatus Saccharimonadales bacterium]|jgi:regulator of protease activity HflC (stomatin/prohibitin superfamily)|nr:SPFH domain-containing protein [Candidatus Saccharimonadales bacterium]
MMFAFMKVPPTKYVLHYKQGKVRREGAGLSFFYYVPNSTIVVVPFASADVPFVFHEVTADFQSVTIQGQLTYRVADPRKLASLLDFSVDSRAKYVSEDPQRLNDRLVYHTQILAQTISQSMKLNELLVRSETVGPEVLRRFTSAETATALGIEILAISVLAIKPTPEMAKALEAEAREALQGRSDEAIYARRNAGVEQERRIKESELNTEIAVEEKQRQIRETKMAAEIAVEEQKSVLIERRTANQRKEADARAYALETVVKPLRDLDWKTLMMISGSNSDPKQLIAMAFQGLAENAQKIGELNISPDLLRSLLGPEK